MYLEVHISDVQLNLSSSADQGVYIYIYTLDIYQQSEELCTGLYISRQIYQMYIEDLRSSLEVTYIMLDVSDI